MPLEGIDAAFDILVTVGDGVSDIAVGGVLPLVLVVAPGGVVVARALADVPAVSLIAPRFLQSSL